MSSAASTRDDSTPESARIRLAHLRRDLDRAKEAYWQASAYQDPERYRAARERYYSLLLEEERLAETLDA